jgi:hypothetical protein
MARDRGIWETLSFTHDAKRPIKLEVERGGRDYLP